MSGVPKKLRAAFKAASVGHVCIDVQKHYCDPADAANMWTTAKTLKDCDALAGAVSGFAAGMRGAAVKHFWVAHTPLPLRRLNRGKSLKQMARGELYKVRPEDGDTVIAKKNFDAFAGTRFRHELKSRGVDTLLLTGLYLDQCVMETAQSALKRGFNVAVVEDLTFCLPYIRQKTLAKLKGEGAFIVASADMLKLARRNGRSPPY
jgi:ureidoacrylate peracid hydrolase